MSWLSVPIFISLRKSVMRHGFVVSEATGGSRVIIEDDDGQNLCKPNSADSQSLCRPLEELSPQHESIMAKRSGIHAGEYSHGDRNL
jgi:hypothetical protein